MALVRIGEMGKLYSDDRTKSIEFQHRPNIADHGDFERGAIKITRKRLQDVHFLCPDEPNG